MLAAPLLDTPFARVHDVRCAGHASAAEALAREEQVARLVDAVLAAPGPGPARGRAATRAAHATLVDRVRTDLAADPARAWTLAELAHRAASSPFHLCRVFRARVGVS